jgi:arsenate reductase
MPKRQKAGTNGEKTLLSKHPTLIKRPVIENGGAVHVGWGKDVQATLLGG